MRSGRAAEGSSCSVCSSWYQGVSSCCPVVSSCPQPVPHLPVAPIELRVAGGAQGADCDLLRGHTGEKQLPPVQSLQIHLPLLPGFLQIGPGRLPHGGGQHSLRHVIVRLKAALSNPRANSRPQIHRPCAIYPLHLPDRLGRNGHGRAPPACVDRPHSAGLRITEENHDAVGGENKQRQLRRIGHQRIRRVVPLPPQSLARVLLRNGPNRVLVDLDTQHRPGDRHAGGVTEAAVVLLHIGLVVPTEAAAPQIQ